MSSGLLSSGLGSSFTQHMEMKAPEPVVSSYQVSCVRLVKAIQGPK